MRKRAAAGLVFSLFLGAAGSASAKEPWQVDAGVLAGKRVGGEGRQFKHGQEGRPHDHRGIPGIDSIPNFSDAYVTFGYDPSGNANNTWYYNMVGAPPEEGDTTVIGAPIIPVAIELLDGNGNVVVYNGHPLRSEASPYVQPVLDSPVFSTTKWDGSRRPTQFTDAVHRAQFWGSLDDGWHTMLRPSVKRGRTIQIPAGAWYAALNEDGTCCQFILADINVVGNLLYPTGPADRTSVVGAAELDGDITTRDIHTLLTPDLYLYFNGDPNQCCVLGFHTFDVEPGDKSNHNRERRYVGSYASWMSPGLFGPGWQDVIALSHEVAEIFSDPFVASDGVHNITPWWLSGGVECDDRMEVGDVIEVLGGAPHAVTMNGYTYHAQNVALLPWFAFESPSSALRKAYSYPDAAVLPALSPVEKANCAP